MGTGYDSAAAYDMRGAFDAAYGLGEWREHWFVQTPGRTEIAGNHTDHQGGHVIAAAVDRCVQGVFTANEEQAIHVASEGYAPVEVRVDELSAREDERNTTVSLVRGMAAQFAARGFSPRGFDAAVRSGVLSGSGLSSSAAFELELGQAMNVLWAKGILSPEELAVMAQAAERDWFGKPCGLMDQAAVALGGIQHMSFATPGTIDAEPIDFDFADEGYAICLTSVGASHADLTDEYAAIPNDMFQIARALGVERLSQAVEVDFAEEFPQLREEYGDRAVLRALHFYHEDKLVECRAKALRDHDMDSFVALTRASGISSGMYLQNVSVSGSPEQPAMIAIAISDELLFQSGCCRIHGGGFGGTVQAFVPQDKVDELIFAMDYVFGKGSCQVYQVDHEGARAWKL